jgi:hypothetical protein
MSSVGEDAGLNIRDDPAFQRGAWRVERVAWVFFGGVLLAAALGLFGGGPLSDATERSGAVSVHYERFARRLCAIEVIIRAERAASDTIVVEATGPLLGRAHLERITPQPTRETPIAEGTRFVFAATPGVPAEITLRLEPHDVGRNPATVRIDGVPLAFSTFVFP